MLQTSGRLQYIRFEQRYHWPPPPLPRKSPRISTNLTSRPGRGWGGGPDPGTPQPAPRLDAGLQCVSVSRRRCGFVCKFPDSVPVVTCMAVLGISARAIECVVLCCCADRRHRGDDIILCSIVVRVPYSQYFITE